MKTNWEHQKEAIVTDQKVRAEDEHLREVDKRHLKESEENEGPIPEKKGKGRTERSGS